MGFLSSVPRGSVLSPIIEAPEDAQLAMRSVGHALYDTLTKPQRTVYDSPERFKMLCSGRRFGKTYLCVARLINWATEKPNSLNWYVTANYRMAKQIAWRQLKIMVPPEICVKRNESELYVRRSQTKVVRHGLSRHLQGSTGFMTYGSKLKRKMTGKPFRTARFKAATCRQKKSKRQGAR